jgi:Metal binding domain of Ada
MRGLDKVVAMATRLIVATIAALMLAAAPLARADSDDVDGLPAQEQLDQMEAPPAQVPVVGNSNSHIFFWPGCPNYAHLRESHRVNFADAAAAEKAGYRPARRGSARTTSFA